MIIKHGEIESKSKIFYVDKTPHLEDYSDVESKCPIEGNTLIVGHFLNA